jgi:hypothetical protein
LPKRKLTFGQAAESARNAFRKEWGENARICLDWLEQETRLAPEAGNHIGSQRFALVVEVDDQEGTFRCRAVYIFNDTAVQWLLFSYTFIPAK